ncbi:hypothetical protein IscW_ISCW007354, partial [Ixodes scapularis]
FELGCQRSVCGDNDRSLPVSDFEWMTKDGNACLRIDDVPDDGPTGYILEVDLRYPHELHDTHFDFSLAP